MVTTSPMTMNAVARTVRVRVVATNADGTLGQGEVKLTTSIGELDDELFTLDEYGTAGRRADHADHAVRSVLGGRDGRGLRIVGAGVSRCGQ